MDFSFKDLNIDHKCLNNLLSQAHILQVLGFFTRYIFSEIEILISNFKCQRPWSASTILTCELIYLNHLLFPSVQV